MKVIKSARVTQAQKILKHLTTRDKITSIEAIGLYGITRLAAVILQLKKVGVNIESLTKQGVNACYTEYRLVK